MVGVNHVGFEVREDWPQVIGPRRPISFDLVLREVREPRARVGHDVAHSGHSEIERRLAECQRVDLVSVQATNYRRRIVDRHSNDHPLVMTGVLLNAIAQLALKASVSDTGVISLDLQSLLSSAGTLMTNLWLWVGLICYAVSVVVWILALSRVDVSIAYPMLSIGYILNAVAASHLFNEPMGLGKIIGIGVIILGVYILARS